MSTYPNSAAEKCLENCTEQQRAAIKHMDGPLLVLAGAGSGKTRVITRRIAYLIANGVPPHDILAITFTNKAANEMRERVGQLIGAGSIMRPGGGGGVWISTFHSLCARILRHHADKLGLTQSFTIYDTSDSVGVIKRAMSELEIPAEDHRPPDLLRTISNLKNQLFTAEEFASEANGYFQEEILSKVYRKYTEALKANNAVDFDDLLMHTERLLREFPEVRDRYARRFRYLLIDEYQDTNRAQYMIARSLASHYKNICVTGDPDQSIYGWRGADIKNILAFEKDYPDAVTVMLERNYRSTKSILEAANKLIVHNRQRKPKALLTENADGAPIQVQVCEDDYAEANYIAADIARRRREGLTYDDIAIFYRTNAQSRTLETALRDARIPHKVVAGMAFFDRKEVKDVLAYLKVCSNPADRESLERILNAPPRGIGDMSRARLRVFAARQGLTLFQALARGKEAGLANRQAESAAKLVNTLTAIRARQESIEEKLKSVMNAVEYRQHLESTYADADERWRNCEELVNLAAKYDADALEREEEPNLAEFLESMALSSDQDSLEGAGGCVKLMTLHTAKGLEFPIVYITGVEEGLMPLEHKDGVKDLEEERRLFFVGITRAMRELVITYAICRRKYGKTEYTAPSRFLQEIPSDMLAGDSDQPARKPANSSQGSYHSSRNFEHKREYSRRGTPRPGRHARGPSADVSFNSNVARDSSGSQLKAGDTVRHPNFGMGRIQEISGSGDSARVTVIFGNGVEKRLVLKHARLQKVYRR